MTPVFRLIRQGARLVLAFVLLWNAAACGRAVEIDFAQSTDPKIEVPAPVLDLSARPLPLWVEALTAAETDVRREAADTIVLAHRLEMPDLATTVPALTQALERPDQHPLVVAAVARALIALDARQTAPMLLARAKAGGHELAQLIEPALARWDYQPVRQVWLERLSDRDTRRVVLLLAIDGLATVGEKGAVPRLEELAASSVVDPAVRLAAARALGRLKTDGLERIAGRLAATSTAGKIVDHLIAASLLRRHRGEAALQLLTTLALDPEPAVAAIALEGLLEYDFRRVLPSADLLAASNDANVRRLTAQAWVAQRTPSAVGRLSKLLDDPHPGVRVYVRESLLAMTVAPALREAVLDGARDMLAGPRWRGLEQSVVIMAALERKETAGRMVELLDFDRPEVLVAAAWGLRRLAVPSTRPAILRKAEQIHELQTSHPIDGALERQFCHLAEALGLMHYAEALPLLRQYVPKNMTLERSSRVTAIWAIGHILSGNPEPDMVQTLCGRVADRYGMMPELVEVRTMSAVTLGRMRADGALATLREFRGGAKAMDTSEYACGWAIHVITGEAPPTFEPRKLGRSHWFLEPLE